MKTFAWLLTALLLIPAPGAASLPSERLRFLGAPLLIGQFVTVYPGSSDNRNFNMARACQSLSGQVVAPGQVFSFNRTVGQAGAAGGYRKSKVFVGNRIVEDYGGGVCQVASTLYNAAIRANLAIAERSLHGLSVPYVAPGQDATVAYGFLDLKWRNDTTTPVVIEAAATGDRVEVSLYGGREPKPVIFHHQVLRTIPVQEESSPDPSLAAGQTQVVALGQPGLVVHSWLDHLGDGQPSRDLGLHTYRMSPRLIRVGKKTSDAAWIGPRLRNDFPG